MSSIQQGLLIAAIGMGLVFVVITLLWGVMALLVQVTSRPEKKKVGEGEPEPVGEDSLAPELHITESQRRAAAATVAVQLALSQAKKPSHRHPDRLPGGSLSPWQAVFRARQRQHKDLRG
jgi:Na+-transporting methylmalonyl-CoA/oxaloacetate decarboxylase gamma subunit